MKKLSYLLLSLVLLCATAGFAQETDLPVSPASASIHNSAGRATGCQQLKTNKKYETSNRGIAFNVVARQNIVITSLDNVFYEDSIWVHLYYKNGAYRGDSMQQQWIELDSVYIAHADTTPTRLPILINKPLATADTMAFFIMSFGGYSSKYGYGTSFNSVSAQNTQVKVLEGVGVGSSLSTFSPRVFMGNINYCPQGQGLCAEDRYLDNLTNNTGIMTDIKANKNITLSAIGAQVHNTNGLTLYSKPNSHLGFEVDSTAWTKVTAVTFPSTVSDSLIIIKLPTPLDLDSGKSVAYYITTTSGSGSLKYQSQTLRPISFPSFATELYQIPPISGITGRFGSNSYPRTFSGALDVCLRSAPNAIYETKKLELNLYPNPANDLLNITTDGHEAVSLDVIDMQGRVVMNTVFQGVTTLDVAQLPTAVYQLYLHNANGAAVKRFVKN